MSAECERVFSCAKKTVTDERNWLKPAQIEANECQKDWLKKVLVKSYLHSPDCELLRQWGQMSKEEQQHGESKANKQKIELWDGSNGEVGAIQIDWDTPWSPRGLVECLSIHIHNFFYLNCLIGYNSTFKRSMNDVLKNSKRSFILRRR